MNYCYNCISLSYSELNIPQFTVMNGVKQVAALSPMLCIHYTGKTLRGIGVLRGGGKGALPPPPKIG